MKVFRYILLVCLIWGCASQMVHAQFRSEAFTQNYNEDTGANPADTSDKLFSFEEYFGGLAHKRPARIGTLVGGSAILVGGCQIYNKQYWKLPIVYGGLAVGLGGGIWTLEKYKKTGDEWCKNAYPWFFAAAGLTWWASLLDGAICYHADRKPDPGKSTIYSLLCPGMGQIYNGESWKVPIYWACLVGSVHFYVTNKTNYERYRWIYDQASNPETSSSTPIPAETAKWYRDEYRRYRDYSVLALAGFYLLQVIDANVFAYMGDFEVNDNISMRVSPAVITPYDHYAGDFAGSSMRRSASYGNAYDAYGLKLALKF